MSLVIIKAGCKIMFACKCDPKEQLEGREASVLPWQSPRWAVSPYSVSCSYPPALWLWKAKKSSVNSLHRDKGQPGQSREHRLVSESKQREHTNDSTHLPMELLVSLTRVPKRIKRSLFTIYCPQGLLYLNLISLSNFRSSS